MGSHSGNGATTICLADPEPGDFVCVPIAGEVGTGIKVGQWLAGDHHIEYQHAEVYVGKVDGAPDDDAPWGYTYSAYPDDGKGTRSGKRALPAPPHVLPGAIWSSGVIKLTTEQRQGIVQWCYAHPSIQYSFVDYGAIALKRFGIRPPALRTYIESSKRMICSYYADAAMLNGAGVHLFDDGRWPGEVTPGDLADMLYIAAHLASLTPE